MRAVNLLPRELLPQQRALPRYAPIAGAAAVPVIALVLVFVGYSRAHSTVTSDEAQLASAQAAAAAAGSSQTVPATATADATLTAERTQRLNALQTVLADQIPWDVSLNQFARALPANVWLSSLTATSPTPESTPATTAATTTTTPAPAPAAPAATSFTITGYARTEDDVALLLQHLQLLPSLTNVTLGSVTQSTVGNESVVQFTVMAAVQSASAGGQP